MLDVRHSPSCESGYLHTHTRCYCCCCCTLFLPFSVLCIYMGTVCAAAAAAADVACVYVLLACVVQFHWRHSKIWRQNIRWYFHAQHTQHTKHYSVYLLSFLLSPIFFSLSHDSFLCHLSQSEFFSFDTSFISYMHDVNFVREKTNNCIAAHNKLINAHTQSERASERKTSNQAQSTLARLQTHSHSGTRTSR